jgi:hypothetical protein
MNYSTMPTYDVSIQKARKGLACVLCSFMDMTEQAWVAESTQEMVDHLAAHARAGDSAPEDIVAKLWADDATNYPKTS